MEKYLGELGTIIIGQVELYEEQMFSAIAEGNENQDEREIEEEVHRPLPDELRLTELKREKLRIKDEIAQHGG